MKNVKFLLVACLLVIASTASAQFVNTSSSGGLTSDATAWSGLRLSYNPVSVKGDGDDVNFNDMTLGYVKSFGVTTSAPLFIEGGVNLSWFGGDIEDFYDELKLNVFSVSVPVNFGYKFSFADNIGLFPYAGLTLRGNIVGKYKYDGESFDAFDEDESQEMQLKRFQIGWQIGVGANFNKFYVGASYGTDFMEIIDGGKVAMPSLTIGFNM